MATDKKTFYVTTPIYYVNDKPHIGHLCTTLAADVLARFNRLQNKEVFFLTGTDEHGAKIAEAAANAKQDPKTYCDDYAQQFQKNWDDLNLSYDFFIRTTDPRHEAVVKEFIQSLYDQGFIYKGTYEGLYCVGCEKFLTDSDLVDGKCPLHPNKEPVKQKEENYFFKLSQFEKDIYQAITDPKHSHYYEIYPEDKKQEILNKIKEGLNDISISRAEVAWGIPIPWDTKQTIYVWFEALLNYFTATQFVEGKQHFWPADVHIVGKDISWFHTVIWQAMLLAAKKPLPKKIMIHSFYLSGGQKMSKSIGNVIAPEDLINRYGLEATRYLILSSFPFPKDSDITFEYLDQKYNADLANGLGNLVQRVSKLCEKAVLKQSDLKITASLTLKVIEKHTLGFQFHLALEKIWQQITTLDRYINETKPWEKGNEELKEILSQVISQPENEPSLINIAKLLKPFLPETSEKIEAIFKSDTIEAPKTPLFPRLK